MLHTKMPVGIDDFAEARKGYYLVDKTEIIGKLLEYPGRVTLFTRPRRFGKTMMLSMLRYFLNVENAEEHRKLFEGLKVAESPSVMQEQGKRPVLFLTLKGWKYPSWERMQQGMVRPLAELFRQYRFLLKGDMDSWDRRDFETFLQGEATVALCQEALLFLMRLLHAHYGKKVVLLLDEYDVPIQTAWENGYYDDAIHFFRPFLSAALKTNLDLDFAVLTGVLRISKESIFSDLNNLAVDSLLATNHPTAMGFTSPEVQKMTKDLGNEDKLQEIRSWYDGYRLQGEEIYNPWSVLNYFDNGCRPGTYWVNTSGNAILGELMRRTDAEHLESLEGLLQGGIVQGYLREGVIYSDIGEDEDALYTMLLSTGYLTVAKEHWTGLETRYDLRLPNKEMLVLFTVEVLKRFQKGLSKSYVERLMQAFLTGDIQRVQNGLSRYFEVVVSSFDTAQKEAFYHGFVLGMTAILVMDYDVRSNRESGYGRYDIAVFPKIHGKPGVLLEFKVAATEEELEKKAQEALQQMEERDYDAEFRVRGVRTMHHYGIAFCGKQVKVLGKSLDLT